MTPPDSDDRLSERRYVTVVIRVLVDGQGDLVHAELVAPSGPGARRASDWWELARLVRTSVGEAQARGR